jgi:hypothetical protein
VRIYLSCAYDHDLITSSSSVISLSKEKKDQVQKQHNKLEEWTALLLSMFPHWVRFCLDFLCISDLTAQSECEGSSF